MEVLATPPLKLATATTTGGSVFGSRHGRRPSFSWTVWISSSVNMRRPRATVPPGMRPSSIARSRVLRDSPSSSDTSLRFQLLSTLLLAGSRAAVSASARISEARSARNSISSTVAGGIRRVGSASARGRGVRSSGRAAMSPLSCAYGLDISWRMIGRMSHDMQDVVKNVRHRLGRSEPGRRRGGRMWPVDGGRTTYWHREPVRLLFGYKRTQ